MTRPRTVVSVTVTVRNEDWPEDRRKLSYTVGRSLGWEHANDFEMMLQAAQDAIAGVIDFGKKNGIEVVRK